MARMMVCGACRTYTLAAACPSCRARTVGPGPAKWSPEDAYGDYRRRLKKMDRSKAAGAADSAASAPAQTSGRPQGGA